jgi:lytic cellulose monooxygenase (C1-hydroxylating)
MSVSTRTLCSALSLLSLLSELPSFASAHGSVTNININGEDFPGYPSDAPGSAPPSTIAWAVNVPDNGFTRDYSSPDIICHKEAVPGKTSASVAAGGTVEFEWTKWPAHQGPVVDYMAACPGKCEDVDKTKLQWFKIAEQGLLSQTGCNERGNTGCWALDKLREQSKWPVTVPSDLKAGNYVMRHEPINLDFPGQSQNYPACINLVVTGGGSSSPEGVVGTSLYTGQEPGLNFDIYNLKGPDYPIPGPPIAAGGGPGGSSAGNGSTYAENSTGDKPSKRCRRWVA